MEIEMQGRHKNTLLRREEINFEIMNVNKTPSRVEVRKLIAAKLGADESLVMVEEITHSFGSTIIKGFAKKYDSIEDLKKIELTHMRKRHGEKMDEKGKAPEGAAAPPAPAKEA